MIWCNLYYYCYTTIITIILKDFQLKLLPLFIIHFLPFSTQHTNDVIHRDIKPDNVFFTSGNIVKIGDFSFSIKSKPSDYLKTNCGSPHYAAPEIFATNGYRGRPIDIWAIGITLFFMLTSKKPFNGSSVPEIRASVNSGVYTLPENLTPSCKILIDGILTADPEKRFTMKDIIDSEWLKKETALSASYYYSIFVRNDEADVSKTVDPEILENMQSIGIPDLEGFEPADDASDFITGTYRILLHKKNIKQMTSVWPERIHKKKSSLQDLSNPERIHKKKSSLQDLNNLSYRRQRRRSVFCTLL